MGNRTFLELIADATTQRAAAMAAARLAEEEQFEVTDAERRTLEAGYGEIVWRPSSTESQEGQRIMRMRLVVKARR